MKGYDYARADREASEPRASIIGRYRSLIKAANDPSQPLDNATQYAKGARRLRARHQLTDQEIAGDQA